MLKRFFIAPSKNTTLSGRVSRRPKRFIEVERNGDGLNQVGRLLDLTPGTRSEVEDYVKGKFVFKHCLKPMGWTTPSSDKLDSENFFMFVGPGGEKFYSYDALWCKWETDEEFRKMYPGGEDVQQTLNEFLSDAVEPNDVSPEHQCPAASGLSEPTPGVPIAARLLVNAEEPSAQEAKATSTKKRGRKPKSNQTSKRDRLASSNPRLYETKPCVKAGISKKALLDHARLINERTILLEAIENARLERKLAMLRNPEKEIPVEKKVLNWELEEERIKQKIIKLRKENESK